jgi:transposase
MANTMRIPIRVQREVARIYLRNTELSNRDLGAVAHCSPNTAASVRKLVRQAGKTYEELDALDDVEFEHAIGSANKANQNRRARPDWADVHLRVSSGETLEVIWVNFRESTPGGVGYTQFTDGYRKYKKSLKLTMRVLHAPGDKLFADFAGDKVLIHETDGGEPRPACIFVAALGASTKSFARLTWTQNSQDWAESIAAAFTNFGGATNWVVSDNLKAAVLRRANGTIQFNETYMDCLKHFGSAALPIQRRRPKQNSKAEVSVQLVQRWIVPQLRRMTFRSLQEANAVVCQLMEGFNKKPFRAREGCREQVFQEVERHHLKQLPPHPYIPANFVFGVLVGPNYRVAFEKNRYTVPFQYANARVDLRTTASIVDVYSGRTRIASHARLTGTNLDSEQDEHHPPVLKKILSGQPKELFAWATRVGPSTQKIVEWHLTVRRDPANGLRAVRRLRDEAENYDQARIEEVCAYALKLNTYRLESLLSILRKDADKKAAAQSAETQQAKPHKNLRNGKYYGDDE